MPQPRSRGVKHPPTQCIPFTEVGEEEPGAECALSWTLPGREHRVEVAGHRQLLDRFGRGSSGEMGTRGGEKAGNQEPEPLEVQLTARAGSGSALQP